MIVGDNNLEVVQVIFEARSVGQRHLAVSLLRGLLFASLVINSSEVYKSCSIESACCGCFVMVCLFRSSDSNLSALIVRFPFLCLPPSFEWSCHRLINKAIELLSRCG